MFVAVVVAVLGFLIGATKGGFNSLGTLLTPVLSLVMSVPQAVGVLLPMLLVGDAFALHAYWREWDTKLVLRMLGPAAAGALVGTILLAGLPPSVLRVILAVFVLILAAYAVLHGRIERIAYRPAWWHAPLVGGVTGVASGVFNNGGPTFNSYLLVLRVSPRTFIGTAALFFAVVNVLKVPAFLVAGVIDIPLLVSLWWVVLFIPPGIWAARLVATGINPRVFEWIVIAMLLVSSILLLTQR
ncbi:MAG: sulfite exporter TauE/SafE family protein [Acidobacteriota bacterium]